MTPTAPNTDRSSPDAMRHGMSLCWSGIGLSAEETPLRTALDASMLGRTTWLETDHGQPFSMAGFGNWFRAHCDEAGLTELSAHGVRKAVGSISAGIGCTAHQVMEIMSHDSLEEAERYTRQANATLIGNEGFSRLYGTEQD